MTEYQYQLFADYFQFYLQDEWAEGNLSRSWTEETVKNHLALALGIIGIETFRDMTVPVFIELRDSAPIDDNFDDWDHVNECNINVPSGRIVVAGCSDYFVDAHRISVTPGCYKAQIYYGGLDTLSDNGLQGEDHYRVVLWLGDFDEAKVLKHRNT